MPPFAWLVDACQHEKGGFSCLRITVFITVFTFLGLWVGFSIYEGRMIRLSWEDVTLLSALWGSKALQNRFELGGMGLNQIWGEHNSEKQEGLD